jgi:hypothetical protein
MLDYEFFSKTLFFPKQGILAVGDLHLGYEKMLKAQGIMLPFNQLDDTKKELKEIIEKIDRKRIKKIIFLGDIRHSFGFEKEEYFEVRNFLRFLEEEYSGIEIVLIKGNHDTIQKDIHRDFYIEDGILFCHGDRYFFEMSDKKIKMIVMGHIHPAVIVSDNIGVKREKYKAFLVGGFKEKRIIVVPSFFQMIEGSEINEEYAYKDGWSIIPKKNLKNFDTYVVGEDEVYKFGKFGELV